MSIYFSTNIPEFRAMMTFSRMSNQIADISQRLETGQRINSGKDDPVGLTIREGLRTEIKNYEAAKRSVSGADGLMQFAESNLASLTEIIQGTVGDDTSNGMFGLLAGTFETEDQVDTFVEVYNDLVNVYNGTVASSTYNGAEILGTDGVKQNYAVAGSTTGLDFELAGGHALAEAVKDDLWDGTGEVKPDGFAALKTALQTELDTIQTDRGYIGYKQSALATYSDSLDSRLVSTTQVEGQISNADLAMENSRLARAELLSQNALNVMQYSQSYASFMVNSIFS